MTSCSSFNENIFTWNHYFCESVERKLVVDWIMNRDNKKIIIITIKIENISIVAIFDDKCQGCNCENLPFLSF